MPDEPVWLELLQRVGLALAIGFLVGVERGWKQRDDGDGQRVAGIRTFALIGLLGGVSGLLLPTAGALPIAAMALAFGVAFAAFQFRQAVKDGDNSVTSTVAGLLVFALGFYAVVGESAVGVMPGVLAIASKGGGLCIWRSRLTSCYSVASAACLLRINETDRTWREGYSLNRRNLADDGCLRVHSMGAPGHKGSAYNARNSR